MKTIVFLVSGGGGSLKYIYHSNKYFQNNFKITAVIGDRESDAISFAKIHKICNYVINYKRSTPDELNSIISTLNPDIIITNIFKILDNSTLQSCASLFINLHYSLLPSFKGLIGMATVNEAKILNSRFIGVTSHVVSEEVDCGTIISQASFKPNWNEQNIEVIYDTIFQAGCIVLLSTILLKLHIITNSESKLDFLKINGNNVTFSDILPITPKMHSVLYKEIHQV